MAQNSNKLYTVLSAVALICIILFGTIEYANNLSQRIKDKNEMRELNKELLKLEILKLKSRCNCT